MGIDVRHLENGETKTFLTTLNAAFGTHLVEEDDDGIARFERVLDPKRMFGAFDGDAMVGTAGAFAFTLTIPGGEIPAGGVTMVGVLPSHRRRGILTQLMRTQLEDEHARGESVAYLWASEDQIYQRFGYGLTSGQGEIEIERQHQAFLDDPGPVGKMRMVDKQEALKIFPAIYERVRATTPGMFVRSQDWWDVHRMRDERQDRDGASKLWLAVWENDGVAEAYSLHRTKGEWRDGAFAGTLRVVEAIGATPTATREIWRFLFGVDLNQTVSAFLLPQDHPLLFMLREPSRLRFKLVDTLWLRIVDVKGALEARSYAGEGTVVFDVHDTFCPWNEGRWKLTAAPGGATVEKTTDDADLSLTINELGATYLGGSTFVQLRDAGRLAEATPGSVAAASALFRVDRAPWCPEIF